MNSDLLPVPFRNTTLFVTDINGQPYTPMKPIVEGMGLDWKSQHKKLTDNQRFATCMVEITIPSNGGLQSMSCMPLRKLPGWMTSIYPNKVRPEIRDNIIAYQNECDDVLWDYWSKGQAINPRPMKQPTSAAIPTDLPTALRAYAAEIESHHDDSSMIEMLNQQLEILKELLEICLNQLAFQQCDDPDKATSKAFRHQLSAPFINYIAKDHRLHETPKDDAFRRALDQLFIGTFEELKTIKAYLEITFRW